MRLFTLFSDARKWRAVEADLFILADAFDLDDARVTEAPTEALRAVCNLTKQVGQVERERDEARELLAETAFDMGEDEMRVALAAAQADNRRIVDGIRAVIKGETSLWNAQLTLGELLQPPIDCGHAA